MAWLGVQSGWGPFKHPFRPPSRIEARGNGGRLGTPHGCICGPLAEWVSRGRRIDMHVKTADRCSPPTVLAWGASDGSRRQHTVACAEAGAPFGGSADP